MTIQPTTTPSSNKEFNIDTFRLGSVITPAHQITSAGVTPSRQVIRGEFVKAIPLKWLAPATAAPGKVLATALAIWFEYGRRKNKTFKVTTAILKRFSVTRKARYHALQALEELGLITVKRELGKNPIVTVIATDLWVATKCPSL